MMTSDTNDMTDTASLTLPFSLSGALAHQRWWQRNDPFRHIVAQNVFTEEVYQSLEQAFQGILSRGFGDHTSATQFTRSLRGYDAYTFSFTPDTSGPMSIFLSCQWHDMIADLLWLNATQDINGGLHHHNVGSTHGHLHNDLNPGWFVDCHRADGINVSNNRRCSYQHGNIYGANVPMRETVRAAAMIFYLNNPAWSTGDGGETGLYRSASDPVDKPAAVVPPINNSLLLFECTPYSYHSFIKNWRHPRNSVILWLHRPKTEVISRWGEERIVYWPKR